MNKLEMPYIKPCPFCGGEAEISGWYRDYNNSSVMIICTRCGATTREFTYDKYDKESKNKATINAINVWNLRYIE